MDVQSATTATAASTTTSTTAATTTKAPKKSFSELFTAAEKSLKTGEKLEKVTGHHYARIAGGQRDQMCVNLSGNGRSGEAFDIVHRDGHTFHVYAEGSKHVVVELPGAAASGGTAAKS